MLASAASILALAVTSTAMGQAVGTSQHANQSGALRHKASVDTAGLLITGAMWHPGTDQAPIPFAGRTIFAVPYAKEREVLGAYCRLDEQLHSELIDSARTAGRQAYGAASIRGGQRLQRMAEAILSDASLEHATTGIDGHYTLRIPTNQVVVVMAIGVYNIELGNVGGFPLTYVWAMPMSSITDHGKKELNLNSETQLDPVCK